MMGCLNSKKEILDAHPNVFRVVNIDENGADLCSGHIEITETHIVLYREGRDSTVWPLHSLRRYGFDSEIFSFEAGRRCDTGEGIYAFRSKRAPQLFRTLQRQIQLRNVESSYPPSLLTSSPHGRQTVQASVVHRSSIDNGQPDSLRPMNNNLANMPLIPRNISQSPRSPSSVEILEVMPLYPRNQNNSNHASNVYQVRGFKRENNNNQGEAVQEQGHVYSNDLSRDLAILRNSLRQETALNTMRDIEDETRFLQSRYVNENVCNNTKSPLSPTLSTSSEHYAQLSLEQQESARLYMNIAPEKGGHDVGRNELVPPTPTLKQVEYCNLAVGVKQETVNSYANLSLGETGDVIKHMKNLSTPSDHTHKFFDSDFTCMSPVEELEVNYAVLDIDSNKEIAKLSQELTLTESQTYSNSKIESVPSSSSSQTSTHLVLQCSIEKPTSASNTEPITNIGYTTIDFDKTVALTSVAAGAEADGEGSRKTRHNSCNILGSPNREDKLKTVN